MVDPEIRKTWKAIARLMRKEETLTFDNVFVKPFRREGVLETRRLTRN